jgi:hypothetical protein
MNRVVARLGLDQLGTETVPRRLYAQLSAPANPVSVLDYQQEITNAFDLSEAMLEQKAAEDALNNPFEEKVRSESENAAEAVEVLARKFPKLDGVSGPLSAISDTLKLKEVFDIYGAYTLPSEFTALFLNVGDAEGGDKFLEDAYPEGCDEAILEGWVIARSKGLDWSEAVEFDPTSPFRTASLKNWGLIGRNVPAQSWTVPIIGGSKDGVNYVDVEPLNNVLEVNRHLGDGEGVRFGPLKVGLGTLKVRISGILFGERSISEEIEFPVIPLQVQTISGPGGVPPKETVQYRVRLRDAWYEGEDAIKWSATAGSIEREFKDGNDWVCEWKAPEDESEYPVTITATSAAEGCLRGEGAPVRQSQRTIFPEAFEITPMVQCLTGGSEQLFEVAFSDGSEPPEVNWSVVSGGGSIDSDGLYTAPDSSDEPITIRATDSTNPEKVAEHTFGIDCEGSLTLLFDPSISPLQVGQTYQGVDNATFTTVFSNTAGPGGSVLFDTFLTVNAIEETDDEGVFFVYATISGAGIWQPTSEEEADDLIDNSQNNREFQVSGAPAGQTYTVSADVDLHSQIPDLDLPRSIALSGSPDSFSMSVGFRSQWSTSIYRLNAFDWLLPMGGASGEEVIAEIDPFTDTAFISLSVTDIEGGTARQTVAYPIVRISGDIAFKYKPGDDLWVEVGLFSPPAGGGTIKLSGAVDATYVIGEGFQNTAGYADGAYEGPRFIILYF